MGKNLWYIAWSGNFERLQTQFSALENLRRQQLNILIKARKQISLLMGKEFSFQCALRDVMILYIW